MSTANVEWSYISYLKKLTYKNLNLKIGTSYIYLISTKYYNKGDFYGVLFIGLSIKYLDTAPVRYGLHYSVFYKHKFIKRDVTPVEV